MSTSREMKGGPERSVRRRRFTVVVMRVAVLATIALVGATVQAPQAHAATSPVPAVLKPGELVKKPDGTVLRGPLLPQPKAARAMSPAESLPIFIEIYWPDFDGLSEHFWIGKADGTLSIPGSVWHQWQNPDGSWSGAVSLDGWFTSGMDVCSNADGGRIEIFGRAGGADLVHKWQLAKNGATGWSGWATLGGSLLAGSGVAAGCFSDNSAFVQVIGNDNAGLHTKFRNASGVWDTFWS